MAKSLVENLSEPFKPEKYDDTYRKELLDLLRAKAKGKPLPEPEEEEEGEVVDLMAALRESVERTQKQASQARHALKRRREPPRVRAKTRPARRPRSRSRASGSRSSRSSSSSVTTRGGCTTTSGWSGTALFASWAVPKGVPLEPGQQHLAVHVEDHPLEYATFEGEIPKGQYGAGTVEIWDNGTYELLEEKRDGGMTVRLHGKKLEGTWALVPAHLYGDEKNWLHHPQARGRRRARCAPRRTQPMLATLGTRSTSRAGDWRVRDQVGRLPHPRRSSRAARRGSSRATATTTPSASRTSRRSSPRRSRRRMRSSTARSARSTRRAGRASRRCSRAGRRRRSSTTSSTCSRSRASR